ncbi:MULTISPECIES: riboflavin synthase [Bacillus]|uniref:riboflavin synthase n=1 Tax=Bacillus TaxID=1386 RepID=UPI0002FA82FF|nr:MULTISPECIES: riboflavin synthase [Bacillus]
MFTGIVEDIGTVKAISRAKTSMQLTIFSSKIVEDVHLGDSIAVNGVCLTVTSFTKDSFTVDVMPETVKATSIRDVSVGSFVNLERAMSASGRFGGHIVSGHVDGIGTIIRKRRQENAIYYDIKISEELRRFCIPKGSIAIDGTSLTLFGVQNQIITISLIPHTVEKTVIGRKKEGDIVNVENDMLGKYIIYNMEGNQEKKTITEDFLRQNGF